MGWKIVQIIRDDFEELEDGRSKATRIYFCENDTPSPCDGALSASANGVTVAARGESYSTSRPRCIVSRRLVERVGPDGNNPFQFTVTVDFEDPSFGPGAVTDAELLALPAKIDES